MKSICSVNRIINVIGIPSFTSRIASIDETTKEVNNLNHEKFCQASSIATIQSHKIK